MNHELALKILNELARNGVKTIALCAGARNAPFVHILEKSDGFEIIPFYDERSAGFFALGRARRDYSPVAIITTSGTAVSELLNAAIEAYYSYVPIVLVTADRPKRLRGSGAPQSIDQKDIFLNYANPIHDFDSLQNVEIHLEGHRPAHINVCFDEPLKTKHTRDNYQFFPQDLSLLSKSSDWNVNHWSLEQSLIVVGALEKKERANVISFLKDSPAPVFLEANSGIKSLIKPLPNQIIGGEKMAAQIVHSGEVKSVLRIGDVPLGRYWRDLDLLNIPVRSLTSKKFKGMEKSDLLEVSLESFDFSNILLKPWDFQKWVEESRIKQEQIDRLVQEFPCSEVGIVKRLLQSVKTRESLYIGNSLPIRLVDLIGGDLIEMGYNRGANGIDGQVSTAFGWFNENSCNWLLLGDLTTLYDSNGFWLSNYLKTKSISLNCVVINNKGGKIFSRIFSEKLFQNQHNLEFEFMAKMWGINYSKVTTAEFDPDFKGIQIIECIPCEEQDNLFWKGYDQLWK